MSTNFKKILSLKLAMIFSIGVLPLNALSASTLKEYDFNTETSGTVPYYIEGNAVISGKRLDASGGKKAAFTPPGGAESVSFYARVKSEDFFILRLYDGEACEEFRINPKNTSLRKLFVKLSGGNLSIIYDNEQIEERKVSTLSAITKAEIENAVIDDVKIGEQYFDAKIVNPHMYIDGETVNLGYISHGGSVNEDEITAMWTLSDKDGKLLNTYTGLSIAKPDDENLLMCEISYGADTITLPFKKVSDLDVLIFDTDVSTGYDKEKGAATSITLKNGTHPNYTYPPRITDWTDYDELIFRAKSSAATGKVYQTRYTSNGKYFFTYFDIDWEKEYKDIILPVGDESSLDATSGSTWSNITGADIQPVYATWQSETPSFSETEKQTSVTYYSTFLRKKDALSDFTEKEYILNAEENGKYTEDYAKSIIEKGHPRIHLTPARLSELKEDIKNDSYLKKTYELLSKNLLPNDNDKVDSYMEKGTVKADEADRASEIAVGALIYNFAPSDALKNWITDSVNALIEGERCEWNWGSGSFLQIGDTMRAIACVYDWMYNSWSDSERLKVRNGIMRYGIEPAIRTLRCGVRWAGAGQGNWNQSLLSGIGMGILALCDNENYSTLSNEVMGRVVESLHYGIRDVDDNGAHAEGVAYWHYAMDTFIPFEAALSKICGTNGGLLDYDKMAKTGYFPIMMTGYQGIFSFADSFYPSNVRSAAFYRLSEYYNNPAFGAYQYEKSNGAGGGDYLSFLLYNKKGYSGTESQHIYQFYPGVTESFAIKPVWGAYLAFKGGQNGISHSQHDIGTFVYDYDNVRWICDLGRDSYGDYNNKQRYYRNRAEGNNCIVINPDTENDQESKALAEVTEYKVGTKKAYGIIDMSQAYSDATEVKRGFLMTDSFTTLVIQDEIKADTTLSEVYSFMHTEHTIEISEDKKSAVMKCADGRSRTVYVKLLSNCNAELYEMKAQMMHRTAPSDQFSNAKYKKLAIKAENVQNPTFTLIISKDPSALNEITPLEKWKDMTGFGDTLRISGADILEVPHSGTKEYPVSLEKLDGTKIENAVFSLDKSYSGVVLNGKTLTVSATAKAEKMLLTADYGGGSVKKELNMKKDYILVDGYLYEKGDATLSGGTHTIDAFYEDSTLSEKADIYIAHTRGEELLKVDIKRLAASFIKGDKVRIFIWDDKLMPIMEEKEIE